MARNPGLLVQPTCLDLPSQAAKGKESRIAGSHPIAWASYMCRYAIEMRNSDVPLSLHRTLFGVHAQ
eukprot:5778606-Karenia_brevis.AAC.1